MIVPLVAVAALSEMLAAQRTAYETAAWYRGTPAGVPRTRDLVLLRSQGFSAIVWPSDLAPSSQLPDIASAAGLRLIVAASMVPLSCDAALRAQPERVTVDARAAVSHLTRAIAWRAVAHGARLIAFDPGDTYRYADDTAPSSWEPGAQELARHFRVNTAMFEGLAAGPALTQAPVPGHLLDVVLLQTPRSWVLVATNCGNALVQSTIRLPRHVPAALWTSLLDGSGMSMRATPDGPDWRIALAPGEVAVYLIEKSPGAGSPR